MREREGEREGGTGLKSQKVEQETSTKPRHRQGTSAESLQLTLCDVATLAARWAGVDEEEEEEEGGEREGGGGRGAWLLANQFFFFKLRLMLH